MCSILNLINVHEDTMQPGLHPFRPFPSHQLTFLSPLLARTVNMVFELNSDLALGGLVPDEGVLEKLLCGWSAGICLHETALYKVNEFLGPGRKGQVRGR